MLDADGLGILLPDVCVCVFVCVSKELPRLDIIYGVINFLNDDHNQKKIQKKI